MEWVEFRSTCMPFKRQNSSQNRKNRAGSQKAAKKNRKLGAGGTHDRASQAARPCVRHHGPWWLLPSTFSRFPKRRVLVQSGTRALPWIIRIGSHFANLLDIVWAHHLHFLLTLGSICVNLPSKIRTSQNKRNRRNMGINHKIKHINPQE